MTQQKRLCFLQTSVYNFFVGQQASGRMSCLGEDVVRDATIGEMSQAVFSASPLGDYISRTRQCSQYNECNECRSVQLRFRVVPLAVGDSRGKFAVEEVGL
jgi:hypothetical protein